MEYKIIVIDIRNASKNEIEFIPLNNENNEANEKKTICVEWSGGHYEPKR